MALQTGPRETVIATGNQTIKFVRSGPGDSLRDLVSAAWYLVESLKE